MMRPAPIHTLPDGYSEARHWQLDAVWLILFNVIALLPLAISIALVTGWVYVVGQLRGDSFNVGAGFPLWIGLVLLLATLGLHEWLHGLPMQLVGHKPRYGVKWRKMVLYTTADDALFRRGEYLVVLLSPLIGITLLGMFLIAVFFTSGVAFYIALAVILNGTSSIGDLWMTGIVLQYPSTALIRDEAEGIRIYTTLETSGSVTGN